ncbi:unnamed protein product [Lactuca saligna]|uniref:Uncharacterized protein n=1 Tax=Lactuca saligna TaxID=75948 RepID=A0AA35YBY5_LACSI|nr:unnamed protein product [Lactuca saligna]
MATSSEALSAVDQTGSNVMLNIKLNQNRSPDLDSPEYADFLKPLRECLHYSPLAQALSMAKSLLKFPASADHVDPETISSSSILEMFYQMGYLENLALLSKFIKPNIPSVWNGLFMLFFKSFFERVIGSDSANKLFCTLIYGLYKGINLDYRSVLWAQLVQSTLSSSRHSKISCARFWSVIVKRDIDCLHIQVNEIFVLATIPVLHTSNFMVSDHTKFSFVGSIPEAMLNYVPIKMC